MFLSQKYHEDFGYYHLPYALGFIEEKIVFGFANIDQSYLHLEYFNIRDPYCTITLSNTKDAEECVFKFNGYSYQQHKLSCTAVLNKSSNLSQSLYIVFNDA